MAGDSDEERDEEHTEPQRHRIGLTTSQVAASALAASCAAIVASYLGVAGTISGAAIGSIVATTGSAFYGHAFHTGGKKIVKRLGPTTFLVSEAKPGAAVAVQAGPVIAPERAAPPAAAGAGPRDPSRWSGYRKPAALAAALLVVFGAAITVGLLLGGPIRQTGPGFRFVIPQTTTRPPTATPPTGTSPSPATTTASASAAASASPTGSPDPTPSAGSGASSPPIAGQSAASQGAASQSTTGPR